MSAWKLALAGTLPILGLLLIGISYAGWREHQNKEKQIKEKEKEDNEAKHMSREKELVLQAKGKLEQ